MWRYLIFSTLWFGFVLSQTSTKAPLPEKTLEEILLELNQGSGLDITGVESVTDPPITQGQGGGATEENEIGEDCLVGECVRHYLCNSNKTLNQFGAFIIDDRFGGTGDPKKCHYLDTCCESSEQTDISRIPKSVKREGCGNRYVDGVGLTNVGNVNTYAQFGELPWTMAVLREETLIGEKIRTYQSGGSLIHPRVVLTTAHSIYTLQANQLLVRAGEWDTQTDKEIYPSQDRQVTEIVIHEHFYKPANLNDVALLILDEPFELTDHIQTICLPPSNQNFDHNDCIATGWGKDAFDAAGIYQTILKKIVLPVIPRNECQNQLRTTRLSKNFMLHDSFICAGGTTGVDTCTGDGGSPLVCPIPNIKDRYYQAGIVSWGIGCKTNIPGVYVNMPLFKTWIDQQFKQRQFDTKSYTP